MIPDRILREVGNLVSPEILREILEKLVSVFRNNIETSCGKEKPQRYVTLRATPHLAKMQELGLIEKDPIHKPGCGCAPINQVSTPYGLMKKAWEWYILYEAANRMRAI
jgi:hypothetical protein